MCVICDLMRAVVGLYLYVVCVAVMCGGVSGVYACVWRIAYGVSNDLMINIP